MGHPQYPVRGRLAPSPTGAQHVGNARSYLIAWLSSRSQGGQLALRIEDIDSPRIKPWAAQQILEDLEWLGLDWDSGPFYQTDRLDLYETALSRLKAQNLVYPCTCSRKDVEMAASAPHAEHEAPVYPGTCAGRTVQDAQVLDGCQFAWRFRSMTAQSLGDFVVWKTSKTPAYQLAVVVDDADMGITEVIRGDDLLSSTPRQMELYRALDLSPPSFVHVPLVVGPDGRRLAKRHGDTRLSALREAGVVPHMLIGLLAWSCGWLEEPTPISAAELLPMFRMGSIPVEPFVLQPEQLRTIGYGATEE